MTETKKETLHSTHPAPEVQPDLARGAPSLNGQATRGDRERALDIIAERHAREARTLDVAMRNNHRIVSPEHPTHQQLQSTLRQAAEMLGLNSSDVQLVLFSRYPKEKLEELDMDSLNYVQCYLPEGFVNPSTGTVYLSVPLLEACNYDPQLINSVMYHELAHLILMREVRQEIFDSMTDPLGMRFRDYEVEYHCDRVAALLSSRRGEDPRSIGKALEALTTAERHAVNSADTESPLSSKIKIPLVCTHPATPRRIRANDLLSHQLPIPELSNRDTHYLTPIDLTKLPSFRPYGNLIVEDNSFGNTLTDLSDTASLSCDNRPRELLLTTELYSQWCGEKRASHNDEVIPCELKTLLQDPTTERVSDWLREFAQLACSRSETLHGVIEEFNVELEGISIEQIETLLARLSPARVTNNYEEPSLHIIRDSTVPFCVSILLNRYLQIQTERGMTSLDSLTSLVAITEKHEQEFGGSILPACSELLLLAIDICQNGSEKDHRALVEIISHQRPLEQALILNTTLKGTFKNGDGSRKLRQETTELLLPLIEKYSPLPTIRKDHPLTHYSLCAEIVPLGRDDAIEQPTVLRRIPGGTFNIKLFERGDGAAPITMIEMGDAPISEENLSAIKSAVHSRFTDQFQAKSLSKYISRSLDQMLESISQSSRKLLQLPAPSRDELDTFVTNELGQLYTKERTTTAEIGRLGRSLSETQLREIFASTSITSQIRHLGEAETTAAWTGQGRMAYSKTSYTRAESSSFTIFQSVLLFNDLYRASFDSMPTGVEKADFLLSTFPIKALERDQMLCAALGYPELLCFNDMKSVELRLATESDPRVLHTLREGLNNQALAQIAEVRLFELYHNDHSGFLSHPTILALRPIIMERLPSIAQDVVAKNEGLLALLSAFTNPSRERDKHLRTFIDQANSQALKEALGTLLVDPIVTHVTPDLGSRSRISTDSLFALIDELSPYDKAQALLYFMGYRNFESPTATWLLGGYRAETSIADLSQELTLKAPKGKFFTQDWRGTKTAYQFELPDCLVRAQKALGISISTAENLHSSLLNERTITDFLTTALYGETGIVSDAKVRKEFFKLAGASLIRTSEHLRKVPLEQRKAIAAFVAYAFEKCPRDKLPVVIMKVWEATKGEAEQLPEILAGILSGLGPAFVKFGQKLATLHIPQEYRRAFRQLSSNNKEIDSTLFQNNTEAIFGRPIFDAVTSGRKLGEGSMAATFLAVPVGEQEPKAIKIIHPYIQSEIDQDCGYISELISYLNKHKPFGSLTLPRNTAAIIGQQLRDQINTTREADGNRALASDLIARTPVARFKVAKLDERFSAKGVLAAEFLPGYELDSPAIDAQGHSALALRNEVGLEALRLLLMGSVYQSDVNLGNFGVVYNPSNGNIESRNGLPTVVWYDTGAVEPIAEADQRLLLSIIKCAATNRGALPTELSKLVKDSEEKNSALERICTELASEWRDATAFTPAIIKERFESFFDKVCDAGLEIEDRWLVIANTISMAAPLLEGVSPGRLQQLLVESLKHHKMLSLAERAWLKGQAWLS